MRQQGGFTLLEILLAFALMAMVITLCLSITRRAYQQVEWSDMNAKAVLWGQSLSDTSEGAPLMEGVKEGETEDGQFHWHREVKLWNDSTSVIDPLNSAQLVEIKWRITWMEAETERSFSMQTLRFATASSEIRVNR